MATDHNSKLPTGSGSAGAASARIADEFLRMLDTPLDQGLYLVSTPIGHLGDITLRALAVLAAADLVYCEDTRHSQHLLKHYAIGRGMRSYHEHNAEEERVRILAALREGKCVALISDAGTPLISDPGFKLVREAAAGGHSVFAVPGASSALAALVSSGLPTDAFFFAGFLPPKDAARRKRILDLAAIPASLVFFEAPNRLSGTLASLADALGERPAAVARELTKLHEEVQRGGLAALADFYANQSVKGEVVIVVGPPLAAEVTDAMIDERLDAALATTSLRDAAKIVSEMLGVPKARVYELGLQKKNDR